MLFFEAPPSELREAAQKLEPKYPNLLVAAYL
jgi:hypothetical protein